MGWGGTEISIYTVLGSNIHGYLRLAIQREETSGAEGKEPNDDILRNKELSHFINYRSKSHDLQSII